jgi:lactate racemase
MRIDIEYGDGTLPIDVPDDSTVVRAGTLYQEPPALEDPVEATRSALRNPRGSEPLHRRVDSGSSVVIGFPDRVKGGSHPTSHRRVAIPLILDELERAGVRTERVTLVCGVGLHRKNTVEEFASYLGDDVLRRVGAARIVNHDAEDPDGIVTVGATDLGDHADFNRLAFEADLTIMLGHTMGNPYGGYSGGYKMPCTGFTTWRSIRCHHTPGTLQRDDFVPVSTGSRFRDQIRTIGQTIERERGSAFFSVDAVLNGRSEQIDVVAGNALDVEAGTWPVAGRRTEIEVPGPRANVLVLGVPRSFHYGPGMGSNPVLMLQACGAWVTRAADALARDFVIVAASVCDGWFNDAWFPAYRGIYEKLQELTGPEELVAHEDSFATDPEWVYRYRHAFAYHPFHGFSMAYMGGIATRRAQAVYIVGAKAPGYARGMGCVPQPSFEAAIERAERLLGEPARMIVVPEVSKPAVHLRSVGP